MFFLALHMFHLFLEILLHILIRSTFEQSALFNFHLVFTHVLINYFTPEAILLFILKSA